MTRSDPEMVVVGKVGSAYGIKGWIKVHSFTDPIENILQFNAIYLRDSSRGSPWVVRNIAQGRVHGKGIVMQLEEMTDRNQAELLRGQEIAVKRNQLPEPEAGEYYWIDLLGLKVITTDNVELGVVDSFMETGANDVLVVKGDRERLIPFVMEHVVKQIDPETGVIVVDWDPEF